MTNRIVIEDGFISWQNCVDLRALNNTEVEHQITPEGTRTINVEPHLRKEWVRSLFNRLKAHTNILYAGEFDNELIMQRAEVVCWSANTKMNSHFDNRELTSVLTSVTYLNDGYRGGETFIVNDMQFVPKARRTVWYDGKAYEHGVREVYGGEDRYTLTIWWQGGRRLYEEV